MFLFLFIYLFIYFILFFFSRINLNIFLFLYFHLFTYSPLFYFIFIILFDASKLSLPSLPLSLSLPSPLSPLLSPLSPFFFSPSLLSFFTSHSLLLHSSPLTPSPSSPPLSPRLHMYVIGMCVK